MRQIRSRHADVKVFLGRNLHNFAYLRHVAAHTLALPYCLHFRLVKRCETKVRSKIQSDLSLFHCLVALRIPCSVFGCSRCLCLVMQSLKHPVQSQFLLRSYFNAPWQTKVNLKEGRQKMPFCLSSTMPPCKAAGCSVIVGDVVLLLGAYSLGGAQSSALVLWNSTLLLVDHVQLC